MYLRVVIAQNVSMCCDSPNRSIDTDSVMQEAQLWDRSLQKECKDSCQGIDVKYKYSLESLF